MKFALLRRLGGLVVLLAASTPLNAQTENAPAVAEIPEIAATASSSGSRTGGLAPLPVELLLNQPGVRDNVERVLLFGPRGPILIQATITIDGFPYRVQRERMVQECLRQADTNRDGKPTWEEAFANPRFFFGRFAFARAGGNRQQTQALTRQYDRKADGIVDRDEASALVSQMGGAAPFQVAAGGNPGANPDLRRILDTNGDGKLSKEEIRTAGERLRLSDANGNDLVELAELGGSGAAAPARSPMPVRRLDPAGVAAAVVLTPGTNFPGLYAQLMARYGREGKLVAASFPLMPHIMESLDADANGELGEKEIAGLVRVPPQLMLTVALGKPVDGAPAGTAVTWTQPLLAQEPETNGEANYSAEGVRLRIALGGVAASMIDYRPSVQAMITQYDRDKNGYLDQKDVDDSPNKAFLTTQFERWDENGDGKVYAEEILADYERQLAPQQSQVFLSVNDQGPSLFARIDRSGDGRLSLRELLTAEERLRSLDKDRNGELEPDEIPGEVRLRFSRGTPYAAGFNGVGNQYLAPSNPAAPSGPKWFVHMDRNGDGDVTPREFLGTSEQFRKIDANGDGFIEPAEAAKAG